jgi:hypothetical protein
VGSIKGTLWGLWFKVSQLGKDRRRELSVLNVNADKTIVLTSGSSHLVASEPPFFNLTWDTVLVLVPWQARGSLSMVLFP